MRHKNIQVSSKYVHARNDLCNRHTTDISVHFRDEGAEDDKEGRPLFKAICDGANAVNLFYFKPWEGNFLKYVYLTVGSLSLALGALGAVLPLLPTTPFLLITAFCFAKGSDKFHRWFTGTGLYKKHLEGFVAERAMTLKTKWAIVLSASCMMAATFYFVDVLSARFFLLVTILFHWWYFFFCVRTK